MSGASKETSFTNKTESYCRTLSEMAHTFSENSKEYEALQAASKALLFAMVSWFSVKWNIWVRALVSKWCCGAAVIVCVHADQRGLNAAPLVSSAIPAC